MSDGELIPFFFAARHVGRVDEDVYAVRMTRAEWEAKLSYARAFLDGLYPAEDELLVRGRG